MALSNKRKTHISGLPQRNGKFHGAGGTRTHKVINRRILSPLRLPIPPQPLPYNCTQSGQTVKVFVKDHLNLMWVKGIHPIPICFSPNYNYNSGFFKYPGILLYSFAYIE